MTSRSLMLSLTLFSSLSTGCERGLDACEVAAEHEASVQFGIGETVFQKVSDGDNVPFHSGMQGGQHIFGAVQTIGLVTGRDLILGGVNDGVEMDFTLSVEDIEFGWGGRTVALDGDEEEAEVVGEYIFVEFWELFEAMDDQELAAYTDFNYYEDGLEATIEVELSDSCGTEVSDSRNVLLHAYDY